MDKQPTHRIHWRIVCDATMVGRGFRIHATHERRVWQAGYLYGSLIPERCRFGPRRLVLEGETDYVPPRYHDPAPSQFGHRLAIDTAKWTLKTLYGMEPGRSTDPLGSEPSNPLVEVRVKAIERAAEIAA